MCQVIYFVVLPCHRYSAAEHFLKYSLSVTFNIMAFHAAFKFWRFDPYAADFFQTIFHSFEAEIANAISSSKNNYFLWTNIHLQNVTIRLTKIRLTHGNQSFFLIWNHNICLSSFWFIWIPMLWVYGHYKDFYSYSAGIDFRRQNLTSTDARF